MVEIEEVVVTGESSRSANEANNSTEQLKMDHSGRPMDATDGIDGTQNPVPLTLNDAALSQSSSSSSGASSSSSESSSDDSDSDSGGSVSTKAYHSSEDEDDLAETNNASQSEDPQAKEKVRKFEISNEKLLDVSTNDSQPVQLEEKEAPTHSRFFKFPSVPKRKEEQPPPEFCKKRAIMRDPSAIPVPRRLKAQQRPAITSIATEKHKTDNSGLEYNVISDANFSNKGYPPKSNVAISDHNNAVNPYSTTKSKTCINENPKNPYATNESSSRSTSTSKLTTLQASEQAAAIKGMSVSASNLPAKKTATFQPVRASNDDSSKESNPQSNILRRGAQQSQNQRTSMYSTMQYKAIEDEDEPWYEPQVKDFNNASVRRPCVRVGDVFSPPFQHFFGFDYFNNVQSEISPVVAGSDENVVVAAPTGAGKTCVFEMAIVRLFSNALRHGSRTLPQQNKVVYIAPNKALCDERMEDWTRRFDALGLGIKVGLVTGDVWDTGEAFRNVASSHLILTTPEKWDSVTRRWTDHLHILECIKLLLIDEVHLIGDNNRGPCLETVVCRMKTVRKASSAKQPSVAQNSSSPPLRIVAVSATLPNIVDIASFVEAPSPFLFDDSYRPVPLSTHVLSFGWIGKNQYMFDKSLNKHIPEIVAKYSSTRPTIIFCHTKKETEEIASQLQAFEIQHDHQRILSTAASQVGVPALKNSLRRGSAYHHAGLEAGDRQIIEQAFSAGAIHCLCATSTLAMGVNLPAHLVIIKGTSAWRGAGVGHEQIDKGTLLQMMGRAGRPGFDTDGIAVIMTDNASKKKYQSLSNGMEIVESQLLEKMVETLNTEVSQKVVKNVSQAITWMKSTFFFVRVRKNPHFYGMQGKSEQEMNQYLKDRCMRSLHELRDSSIISFLGDGYGVAPNPASHIMSRHLVPFDVMRRFIELKHDAGPKEILLVLSECEGLHRPVRRSEKKFLNGVYKQIKYKYDGPQSKIKIQKSPQKAFVLLQAAVGQLYLEDYTLRQEMTFTVDYATRMLMAAEAYSVEGSKHGRVALQCLLLRRSLSSSLWGADDGVLNQLRGVGAKTTEKLKQSNVKTFLDIMTRSSYSLDQISGRRAPFGQEVRTAVATILQNSLTLSASIDDGHEGCQPMIICNLQKHHVDDLISDTPHSRTHSRASHSNSRVVTYTLTVHFDRPGGLLMFRKHIHCEGVHRVRCPEIFGKIEVRLVANLVGLDVESSIDGEHPITKQLTLSPKGKLIATSPTPKKTQKRKGSVKASAKKKKAETNQQKRAAMTKELNLVDLTNDKGDIRIAKPVNIGASIRSSLLSPLNAEQPLGKTSVAVTPSPKGPFEVAAPIKSRSATWKSKDASRSIKSNPYYVPVSRGSTSNSASDDQWKQFKAGANATSTTQSQRNFNRTSPITTASRVTSKKVISNRSFQNKVSPRVSWQEQKRNQHSIQKKAFGSPKANPFSDFKFDPNNAESQLEMLYHHATAPKSISDRDTSNTRDSIIPPSITAPTYLAQSNIRRSRGVAGNLRTPARSGMASSIKKRRRESRVRTQDLLSLKANEQNKYAGYSSPYRQQNQQQTPSQFQPNMPVVPNMFPNSRPDEHHHYIRPPRTNTSRQPQSYHQSTFPPLHQTRPFNPASTGYEPHMDSRLSNFQENGWQTMDDSQPINMRGNPKGEYVVGRPEERYCQEESIIPQMYQQQMGYQYNQHHIQHHPMGQNILQNQREPMIYEHSYDSIFDNQEGGTGVEYETRSYNTGRAQPGGSGTIAPLQNQNSLGDQDVLSSMPQNAMYMNNQIDEFAGQIAYSDQYQNIMQLPDQHTLPSIAPQYEFQEQIKNHTLEQENIASHPEDIVDNAAPSFEDAFF